MGEACQRNRKFRRSRKENQVKTLTGIKRHGTEALKKKFLQCFGFRTTSATALQQVVHPVGAIPFYQNTTTTQKAGNQTRVMPL